MKPLLLCLLLLSSLAYGQPDSSYYQRPAESAEALRDSLNTERNQFTATASENRLLHQQNEALQTKSGRFWGGLILIGLTLLALGSGRH